MEKKVKFAENLVPLVLSREKTSTWRLWDDKNLSVGDTIALYEYGSETKFGTAQITKVIEKPMGELTLEDKKGHEEFSSDTEMYDTYTRYYKQAVGPHSQVKIIWFDLI